MNEFSHSPDDWSCLPIQQAKTGFKVSTVLADEDGIVVVPRQEAEAILGQVQQVLAANEAARAQIVAGEDLGWLESALRRRS